MADVAEECDDLLVELDQTFTEFKNGLLWRNFVGREVSVRLRRDQCKEVSHRLSNSTDGRAYMYISLLVAISNDDERLFDWLLQTALDVLSRDKVQPTLEKWRPISDYIDEALLSKITSFCQPENFNRSHMTDSLLQYAVLCGSFNIVERLILMVQNVSSMSKQWCPFLLKGFSCTPLWLACFKHRYSIMSQLLSSGASPYDAYYSRYKIRNEYSPRIICRSLKGHPVIRTILEDPSMKRRQYPVSLLVTTLLIAKGRCRAVEFLESTFRWNSVVTLYQEDFDRGTENYLTISGLTSKVLQLRCYSEEDIIRKQAICVWLLLYVIGFDFFYPIFLLKNIKIDGLAPLIRDLVRHGASVCGFTHSTSSRFVARYWEIFSTRASAAPSNLKDPFPSTYEVPADTLLPTLLAPCAGLSLFTELKMYDPYPWHMEYLPVDDARSPPWFGLSYFWAALEGEKSLYKPVIQELFHCGALPHVKSLECVPYSEWDYKIHDGPTCQCKGVDLSAAQRKMSVAELLTPPYFVQSLQATCRSIILNSCQGHGVVPAVLKLPLSPKIIDYLLYNISRDNPSFLH